MLIFFILAELSLAGKLVEYKFYKNYGEIFYDYSGNVRHAVNGGSKTLDNKEMICTDRGVYSSGGSKKITLPPNDIQTSSFNLATSFSILFWRKWFQESSKSTYVVFSRQSSFFQLFIERITKSDSYQIHININNCQKNKYNIQSEDSPYLWNLATIQIKNNEFFFYSGSTLLDKNKLSCIYSESSSTPKSTTIGSTSSTSFIGFLWNFLILDEFIDINNYMLIGTSNKCFSGTCSCNIQVIDSELGTGCIKIEDSLEKNSKGNTCNCGLLVSCSSLEKSQCYSCNCSPSSCADINGVRKCLIINTVYCDPGFFLNNLNSCSSCHSTCATCDDANTCSTCKSLNSVPVDVGCQCIGNAYNAGSSDLIDCRLCYDECLTCDASGCLTCRAENTEIIEGRCGCKMMFYLEKSLDHPDACQPCHSHCSKCSNGLTCDECLTSQALQSDIKGCYCPVGTYANPNLSSFNSLCSSCHVHCESCSKDDVCTTCKAKNSFALSSDGCKCSVNFFQLNEMQSQDACSPCALNCFSCSGKEYFQCLACEYFLVDQVCFMVQPLGYSCNELRVCQALKPAALRFDFEGSGRNYFESVSGWVASVDYDDKVHIAGSVDRGVYFIGTRGLEVSVENYTIFGTEFSFSFWINTDQSDFILAEKQLESIICMQISVTSKQVKLITLIDSVLFTSKSLGIISITSWNHLLIVLEYTSSSSLTRFYINGVVETSQEISQKPFVAVEISSIFIGSAKDWTNGFKGFMFMFELYVLDPGIDNLVEKKSKGCSISPAGHECIPLCNLTQYSLLSICEECPEECIYGCKNNLTCNLCADDNCLECFSFNKNSCYLCFENWVLEENLCKKCENITYYEKNTCLPCEGLCVTCETKSKCTSCKDFSKLDTNNHCICELGYQEIENNCFRLRFSFKFGIFQNNTIWLSFTESLSLKNDQIKVTVLPDTLKDAKVVRINSSLYNLELTFNKDIDSETSAKVDFINDVVSTKNSLLLSETIKVSLFETTEIQTNSEVKVKKEEALINAKTTLYFGVSAAGAASLLSRDLTTIFSFLNIAEMIYVVYFFNLDLYPPLMEFVLGLRVHSSFPNIFGLLIPESFGIVLPKKMHKYGFKTNILMLNCGIQMTMTVIFLLVSLLLFGLSKIKNIKWSVLAILSNFKYGVFLRILIQSYFDLLLASSFGLEFRNYSNFMQVFNLLVCLAFIIFQVISFFSVFIILKRLSNSLSVTTRTDLKTKFSVLFEEFKEESISCSLYYGLFMARRLMLVLMIRLKFDHHLQLIVAAVLSLTVNFSQICFYILLTRCFKKELINVLNVITELLISTYFFIMLFKFLSGSNISWERAGQDCMIVIFTIWGVNISISIYISFLSIREKVQKFFKARRPQNQVVPTNDTNKTEPKVIFTRQ